MARKKKLAQIPRPAMREAMENAQIECIEKYDWLKDRGRFLACREGTIFLREKLGPAVGYIEGSKKRRR